uniref:Zgc:101663 n=1 Tax=Labrus bergylta TaxID=56723 RepID=A0A3Q3F5J9_9LABR
MRRLSKKKNVAFTLLFLIVSDADQKHVSFVSFSPRLFKSSSDFSPFTVLYHRYFCLVSGFLSVGISSVKRQKGSYLIPTLQSLFSQSSPEERSSMVVVLLLADFDVSWRVSTVKEIRAAFTSELEQGQLLVLHVHQEWYPPLKGRSYRTSHHGLYVKRDDVAALGRYYLQLEDDVSSAKSFLSTIRRRVDEQERKTGTTWAMLEFSTLGFIGKLYKSAHLSLLARFLFLFYQEMPCDWLMSHFKTLLTQKEQILFKPSLFQHMGTFSSFQGTFNKLKDKNFEAGFFNNPPAEVFTDISTYQKHFPKLAWESGEGFFWGRSPEEGNHLTVVFAEPAVVTRILIETGSGGKDLLQSAQVEVGREVVSTERQEKTCKEFLSVGTLKNGGFEMQEVDKELSSASSCLRILVTTGASLHHTMTEVKKKKDNI